jgi:hypothetical protein
LPRSYESNGPDVKIRGNAHHVAEKYLQLARDAHTGGDPVAAENYLQHAEHYFRLIATAQAAQLAAQNGQARPDEDDDDDDGDVLSDRFSSPAERAPPPFVPPPQPQYAPQPNVAASAPVPYSDRQPYENDRQNQGDRNGFQPRQDRQNNNRHQDRGPRPDRPFQDRQDGQRDNRNPRDNRPREFRPFRDPNVPRDPQPVIESSTPAALPSFITAAPRIGGASEGAESPQPVVTEVVAVESSGDSGNAPSFAEPGEARFPRGRRRRLRSPYGFQADSNADDAPAPISPDEAPASD